MINAKPWHNATPSARWSGNSAIAASESLPPRSIASINALPGPEKRVIYSRLIPEELLRHYGLDRTLKTTDGRDLLYLNCLAGNSVVELALYHQLGFPDPVCYGQFIDTLNGHVHILLYTLSDPCSPRFNIDYMPDGTPTRFGTDCRNLKAELAAMQAGLAPGQIRQGMRLLAPAVRTFETFINSLGQDLYFAEPLHYHNAVIFERYGFSYEKGRLQMQRIQEGFKPGGELYRKLDGSTPFRLPEAANSIRLRSWAIHDGLLEDPFNEITMYKMVGQSAGINTCPGCNW